MNTQLKNTRIKLGLTQVEVAKKVKVVERTYQYIEANERTPSVITAMRIAKVLDSTVEELFNGLLEEENE